RTRSRGPLFIADVRLQTSDFRLQDAPRGERHRLEILVALQRGGQRRGALGGEVEITTWRTFVAPRRAHVFPMRREVAERFELVERGVDGAGREPGRIHDVEAE